MPIIFAGSILQLPQILSMFFLKSTNATLLSLGNAFKTFNSTNIWYMIAYFVLIFFFTYFYTAVTFDPKQMSDNLQKNGAFVPGIRPGDATNAYIASIVTRITLVGSLFLGIVAVLPLIIRSATGITAFAIGGTSLLIVVSVVIDLIRRMSAQVAMTEY
jgi:preprotein translocase subunit SecY